MARFFYVALQRCTDVVMGAAVGFAGTLRFRPRHELSVNIGVAEFVTNSD